MKKPRAVKRGVQFGEKFDGRKHFDRRLNPPHDLYRMKIKARIKPVYWKPKTPIKPSKESFRTFSLTPKEIEKYESDDYGRRKQDGNPMWARAETKANLRGTGKKIEERLYVDRRENIHKYPDGRTTQYTAKKRMKKTGKKK